ncbi:MAG: 1-deoxy-D-xylulose-5-phosphate synthase [Clostridia bacterium]|nr:1-deoxy-D-xylulose-5-phosphate synthase [Clostridia bacterium]
MLERIHAPEDLRAVSPRDLNTLAAEIRQTLIDTVAERGGHLASNLGVVELTLALHRVFDTRVDKVLFDVGHQVYTHKLLTGRKAGFAALRSEGGVSGFPKRAESCHDAFETGHASTAISAALGFARARDALHEEHAVVALVGDGALTGGLCYEALNDAGSRQTQLIVLLNDNKMSIAQNVGALSRYLTRLRGSRRWISAKRTVKRGLSGIPIVGRPLARLIERIKRMVKLLLVPGEFFEALGFAYLGPIDGHDVATLERTLVDALNLRCPVVVHAVTQKGRGYARAERQPETFHGVAPFFLERGGPHGATDRALSADVAGSTLQRLAEKDARIAAITAAMPQGTGLSAFAEKYPDRFFDVGIAEEHAMTLAAGMAAGGLRPVFAVYSSFLQRSIDQLLHDVCLQRLPVLVLSGHAGFVAGDGATHQGVYDLSMLRAMPGLTILSPCDAAELREMIAYALTMDTPCVIRYPKTLPERLPGEFTPGLWRTVAAGDTVALIGAGHTVETALSVRALLGLGAVYSASSIVPLDNRALDAMKSYPLIAVLEESQRNGGLSEAVLSYFEGNRPVLRFAVPGIVPDKQSLPGLAEACGLDAETIANGIREALS